MNADSVNEPEDDPPVESAAQWNTEAESEFLGVEVTGIKASVRVPLEAVEDDDDGGEPGTWSEVAERLHGSLRKFVLKLGELPTHVVETVHDGLKGIRGALKLPMAVGKALTRGREKAIARETAAQEKLADGSTAIDDGKLSGNLAADTNNAEAETLIKLEEIARRLHENGTPIRIIELESGQYVIAAVRPDLLSAAVKTASRAIESVELLNPPVQPSAAKANRRRTRAISGKVVRLHRTQLGLSQKQLAAQAEVAVSTISKIERVESSRVTDRVLAGIAAALEVDADRLLLG